MPTARLTGETDVEGWRDAARRLRLAGVPPEAVSWRVGDDRGLLDDDKPLPDPAAGASFSAPREFLDLAGMVILNRAHDRFDRLYRLLWRLKDEPALLRIVTDDKVAAAFRLRTEVAHAIHKMHAFVRFRRVEAAGEPETYAAWFEPPHRVIERGAEFFVRRMANLRFSILSPDACVHWDGIHLATAPGVVKPPAGDDAFEAHWRTYYASVFNPARLNTKVMTQHMPRTYWRNLPEAALIASLTREAEARTTAMVQSVPIAPSPRALRAAIRASRDAPIDGGIAPASLEEIVASVQVCRRCELWRDATQGVPGEGPSHAKLMFVGEQPGDQEDLAGQPVIGPAGQLWDRALAEAGVPRGEAYVTNAEKHFKHELRGKRRIHSTPDAGEVRACKWWLDNERRLVRPKVVVALGATAAGAVLGRAVAVTKERGPAGILSDGAKAFVTVHPSMLLRIPDHAAKEAAYRDFVRDLKAAWGLAA
jgi:probable DNA metabolism protein